MNKPTSFGRYQIVRELGKGGMSTVFLAHDPRFGRDVALKVMLTAFRDDATFRGRFEREARTIAALEHPAIVPVYDFGEDNDQPYLVMRYMPGGSLAERIYLRPFPLSEAVPFLIRIASALDHAHQQGVIHRDLKPANILFDQYRNPFLSDFGIVKLAEGTTGYTGSGVVGTPAYMSPEQIHGEDELDGRSDIYTLGILMFEMLTGIKPYRADTPVKQMMAHVLNPIPNIREHKPDLPPELEPIMTTVLAKQRSQRYRSAADFAEALAEAFPAYATISAGSSTAVPKPASQPPPQQPAPPKTDEPTATLLPLDPPKAVFSSELPKETAVPPASEQPTQVLPSAIESIPLAAMPAPPASHPSAQPVATPANRPRRRWPWLLGGLILIVTMAVVAITLFWPLTQREAEANPTAAISAPSNTLQASPPTPAITEIIVPSATPALAVSPTANPTDTTEVQIAQSAAGTPIVAYRVGDGERRMLLIGGLHAGFAPGSVVLATDMLAYFQEHLPDLPADIALWIIPNLNPDSAAEPGELAGRVNGNGVDLNRNWGCLWQPAPVWRSTPMPGLGGTGPFSEPEIAGLATFIQANPPEVVLFWGARATNGLVSAGSCDERPYVSAPFGRAFSTGSGYQYVNFEGLTEQKIPGDGTNWLDQQGIPAITVLLPEYDAVDFERNLNGIQAIFGLLASPEQTNPPQ